MKQKYTSLIKAGFVWGTRVLAPDGEIIKPWSYDSNMLVAEALQHIPGVIFKGVTPISTWYLAPYEGNYTPISTETGATFAASATESTAYNETVRQTWQCGSVVAGSLDNTANIANFTFNAQKTIYGGGLLSAPTKGGTSNILMSLIRFASPIPVPPSSTFQIVCGVAFVSA